MLTAQLAIELFEYEIAKKFCFVVTNLNYFKSSLQELNRGILQGVQFLSIVLLTNFQFNSALTSPKSIGNKDSFCIPSFDDKYNINTDNIQTQRQKIVNWKIVDSNNIKLILNILIKIASPNLKHPLSKLFIFETKPNLLFRILKTSILEHSISITSRPPIKINTQIFLNLRLHSFYFFPHFFLILLQLFHMSMQTIYLICFCTSNLQQLLLLFLFRVYLSYPIHQFFSFCACACWNRWLGQGFFTLLSTRTALLFLLLLQGVFLLASCSFSWLFLHYIFFGIQCPQIYVIQNMILLQQPSKSLIISLILQNLLQNQAMKRVFIFTGDHEGKPQKIRFYSEFYRPQNIDQIKNQDKIAQIHIITSSKSYFATLKRRNINRELAWNTDLMNKLQNVLSGKSPDLITYLEERQFKSMYLVVATQFQTKFIRVILFEVEVAEIDIQPFCLMKKLMNLQHLQRQECLKNYKIREQKERQKVDQIDQLYNQISQNYRDETNLMKQMFMPVINNAKKKLAKCLGFQDNQDLYQSGQNKSAELQRLRRQFYRIKQPTKPPQHSEKVTEVEHLFGMQ